MEARRLMLSLQWREFSRKRVVQNGMNSNVRPGREGPFTSHGARVVPQELGSEEVAWSFLCLLGQKIPGWGEGTTWIKGSEYKWTAQ